MTTVSASTTYAIFMIFDMPRYTTLALAVVSPYMAFLGCQLWLHTCSSSVRHCNQFKKTAHIAAVDCWLGQWMSTVLTAAVCRVLCRRLVVGLLQFTELHSFEWHKSLVVILPLYAVWCQSMPDILITVIECWTQRAHEYVCLYCWLLTVHATSVEQYWYFDGI